MQYVQIMFLFNFLKYARYSIGLVSHILIIFVFIKLNFIIILHSPFFMLVMFTFFFKLKVTIINTIIFSSIIFCFTINNEISIELVTIILYNMVWLLLFDIYCASSYFFFIFDPICIVLYPTIVFFCKW